MNKILEKLENDGFDLTEFHVGQIDFIKGLVIRAYANGIEDGSKYGKTQKVTKIKQFTARFPDIDIYVNEWLERMGNIEVKQINSSSYKDKFSTQATVILLYEEPV